MEPRKNSLLIPGVLAVIFVVLFAVVLTLYIQKDELLTKVSQSEIAEQSSVSQKINGKTSVLDKMFADLSEQTQINFPENTRKETFVWNTKGVQLKFKNVTSVSTKESLAEEQVKKITDFMTSQKFLTRKDGLNIPSGLGKFQIYFGTDETYQNTICILDFVNEGTEINCGSLVN
jgi:hypothetical protein